MSPVHPIKGSRFELLWVSSAGARMAGEFGVRLWSPGATAPVAGPTLDSGELVLDRGLLGVDDGSVSRAANAPKLRATGANTLRLEVPASSARTVLAIEGVRFEALQHGVPPSDDTWKIAPGQLARPARLARGSSATVALVRQIDWERTGSTHHLLVLPRSVSIAPGGSAELAAPVLIVIGEAAVDLTPTDTLIPATVPADVPVASFRTQELDDALHDPTALDGYAHVVAGGPFRVPESDEEIAAHALDTVAARLLDQAFRGHCFFPVLEGDRRPRLALAYEGLTGARRCILGAAHPEVLVRDLLTWLAADNRAVKTDPIRTRSRRASSPPAPNDAPVRFDTIETRSPAFARVLEQIAHVAETDLNILLLGESGTGKEHLAHAVHRTSPRAAAPFLAVNCSAIAENLIESELFGHKKGAFTGAHADRPGAFIAAQGGTLLLDEIGDAPLRVQLALLRALEARTIRPVGSDVERAVDVRVIGATSRELKELIEQRLFRKDLYYRLAELTFELPPLRERREDIPTLTAHILGALGETVTVSRQADEALVHYDWPGNVRELRNALKRAVALSRGTGVLQAVHFAQLGGGEEASEDGSGDVTLKQGIRVRGPTDTPITFPVHVVRRADEIWREQVLPDEALGSRYDERALNRAALLCLAARGPLTSWARALTFEWHRLFGERWATSEEGRGLRAVLRQLGMDPRDDAGAERVLEAVASGRRG